MRSKKELIILILIIAVAAGYLLLRQKDRLTYELPQVAIDTANIVKVALKGPSGDLMLEKKSDQWQLMPKAHAVDPKKMDDILATIRTLTLTTVVAEKSSDARYDLGPDHRIEVTAWDPNGIVREFSLGKAADTFRHTFVKLPEDHRIFHAQDNFRDRFDLSPAAMRNKRVLTFDSDQITSISVTRNDQTFDWVPVEKKPADNADKKMTTQRQWQTSDQKEMDHAKINQLLKKLATLNCQSYLEPGDPATSSPAAWTIALQDSSANHTFTLYPDVTQNEEKLWPAKSSTVSDPFLLSDWQAKEFTEIMDQLTLPTDAKIGAETSKDQS